MPERIQLSRAKGWRMPPNTVKVDRTTRWGNPFNLKASDHCWTAIAWGFKGDLAGRVATSVAMEDAKGKRDAIAVGPTVHGPKPPTQAEIIAELRGKNLACWCKLDAPCHADVLLELANG